MRRASERWAAATASRRSRRAAAPRRAPPGTGTGSPMALFLRCWTATRARAAAAARSMLESVHSRTAQNEIRVVLGCGGGFLRVLDSRICEVIFVRGSGVKTLDDLDAGLWDLLWPLKWLPWLPRACRRNQGQSRGRSRKLA